MLHILQIIHIDKNHLNHSAAGFARLHPYLSFFCLFVGMPFFILAAVFACTSAVLLPLALLLGWL